MYSSRLDLTTSFQQVIKLSLPGETLFLTVKEPQKWKTILQEYTDAKNNVDNVISVLPFYHRKNVKRALREALFCRQRKRGIRLRLIGARVIRIARLSMGHGCCRNPVLGIQHVYVRPCVAGGNGRQALSSSACTGGGR